MVVIQSRPWPKPMNQVLGFLAMTPRVIFLASSSAAMRMASAASRSTGSLSGVAPTSSGSFLTQTMESAASTKQAMPMMV